MSVQIVIVMVCNFLAIRMRSDSRSYMRNFFVTNYESHTILFGIDVAFVCGTEQICYGNELKIAVCRFCFVLLLNGWHTAAVVAVVFFSGFDVFSSTSLSFSLSFTVSLTGKTIYFSVSQGFSRTVDIFSHSMHKFMAEN